MDDNKADYSAETVRLWRVYKTVKEMLLDRGYAILPDEVSISLAEFASKFQLDDGTVDRAKMIFSSNPTPEMYAKYQTPPTEQCPVPPEPPIGAVWVEFNGEPNIGVKQIREFVHRMDRGTWHTGIFVTAAKPRENALRMAAPIAPKILESFEEQDLLVNITRHELVPKHVLLSVLEKQQLLLRYRLKETQLPRIRSLDPMAKYLCLRRGEVVKIIRRSTTAGRYASYRWVIG